MNVILYSLIPAGGAILAAVVATLWTFGGRARSIAQHLAAGVVFAAVGLEIIPALLRKHEPVSTAVGFSVGVALLLAIRYWSGEDKAVKAGNAARLGLSTSYISAIGVDLFVDGLVIGISFAAGDKQGLLITIALTFELISLALALVGELNREISKLTALGITSALFSLVMVGAVAGAAALHRLPEAVFNATLAGAAAALLYLVTEGLLREAHKEPETSLATATFFIGFLIILLIDMQMM